MKKSAIITAVLLIICLTVTACGSRTVQEEPAEGEEKIILNVWHQWTNDTNELKRIYDRAVEHYMAEHKNIEIRTYTLDTEAYKTKISADFAGAAEGIDVFYYWGAGMAKKLVEADKLLPLDEYIDDSLREQILPGATAAFEYDGKTYSLPSFSWYLTMFCNEDIFEQAGAKLPETYEELLIAVEKIQTLENVVPIASGAKDGWNLALIYQALAMREMGAENINAMLNGEEKFKGEGYRAAAEKMEELYHAGAFGRNPLEAGNDEANSLFIKGNAAMRINGSWFANQIYTDTAAEILPEHVVAMKIPMIEGKGNETDYCGGFVESFWVNKNTEYKKEAAEFAIYLNEEIGNAAYQSGSGFSGWTTREESAQMGDLFLQIEEYLLESEDGVLAWDTSLDSLAANIHNEQVQRLCTPDADIDAFIKAHQNAINK